jgi:hypothetical protein
MRARARTWLLLAIGALYVLSVPWYRETGAEVDYWFGLPDWVAVALGCYVAVAVLNSVAWLLTDMSEEPRSRPTGEPGEAEAPSGDRGPVS